MSTQFTQIEKVFNAASHKKVWDHFTKAQRKNIDQWKKLASELRSVQIEDDEMEMSDDDRDCHSSHAKRKRYDSDSLKEENDSLRCQLEALRNEMSMDRTDIKYSSDFREKQIKVLQETIRNVQTQLLQLKVKEQKDAKVIDHLERRLKEAGVKQLLLKTRIKETSDRLKDREANSDTSEILKDDNEESYDSMEQSKNDKQKTTTNQMKEVNLPEEATDHLEIINIEDDDVKIIESLTDEVVEITEIEDEDRVKKTDNEKNKAETEYKKKAEQEKQNSLRERAQNSNTKEPEDAFNATGNDQAQQSKVLKLAVDTYDNESMKNEEFKSLALNEAKIIALATAYLVPQPFGVSSFTICAYIRTMLKSMELKTNSLEDILKKYTNLFQPVVSEREPESAMRWIFSGFVEPVMRNTRDTFN